MAGNGVFVGVSGASSGANSVNRAAITVKVAKRSGVALAVAVGNGVDVGGVVGVAVEVAVAGGGSAVKVAATWVATTSGV